MTDQILPNLMTPEEQAKALNLLQDVASSDGDIRGEIQWEVSQFLDGFTYTRTWQRSDS